MLCMCMRVSSANTFFKGSDNNISAIYIQRIIYNFSKKLLISKRLQEPKKRNRKHDVKVSEIKEQVSSRKEC